jgi:two-component system, cell cycle sensor histidine kinase and response regulator CckA
MSVVLIVEDELPVRIVAEKFLRRAGHETLVADTVPNALAIINSKQHFNLLFTDMTLGDEAQGGVHVGVVAAKSRPNLPVLYTSGGAISEDARRSFVQPHTFLAKPYSRAQLIQAVSRLLGDEG